MMHRSHRRAHAHGTGPVRPAQREQLRRDKTTTVRRRPKHWRGSWASKWTRALRAGIFEGTPSRPEGLPERGGDPDRGHLAARNTRLDQLLARRGLSRWPRTSWPCDRSIRRRDIAPMTTPAGHEAIDAVFGKRGHCCRCSGRADAGPRLRGRPEPCHRTQPGLRALDGRGTSHGAQDRSRAAGGKARPTEP
jgi:hypothetical protein